MGIGYPIDLQKDGEERSRYEEEESVIASRESWNIFDERKSMCRSEGLPYQWKGDRERVSDGFEFEFKQEWTVLVNSIDMRIWLDPTSLTIHPPNHVCVIISSIRKDLWSIFKKCDEWESLPIHSEMCCSWNIVIMGDMDSQRCLFMTKKTSLQRSSVYHIIMRGITEFCSMCKLCKRSNDNHEMITQLYYNKQSV